MHFSRKLAMRLALTASGLCFGLMVFAAHLALPQTAINPAQAAQAIPATPPTAAAPSSAASDAPAKHAKRTACLKDAKQKKLLGADKTAFLKTCNDSP
jgi:hypothetical protein